MLYIVHLLVTLLLNLKNLAERNGEIINVDSKGTPEAT